jgi:hypothetical protein
MKVFFKKGEYVKHKGQVYKVVNDNTNQSLIYAKNLKSGVDRFLYISELEVIPHE